MCVRFFFDLGVLDGVGVSVFPGVVSGVAVRSGGVPVTGGPSIIGTVAVAVIVGVTVTGTVAVGSSGGSVGVARSAVSDKAGVAVAGGGGGAGVVVGSGAIVGGFLVAVGAGGGVLVATGGGGWAGGGASVGTQTVVGCSIMTGAE